MLKRLFCVSKTGLGFLTLYMMHEDLHVLTILQWKNTEQLPIPWLFYLIFERIKVTKKNVILKLQLTGKSRATADVILQVETFGSNTTNNMSKPILTKLPRVEWEHKSGSLVSTVAGHFILL